MASFEDVLKKEYEHLGRPLRGTSLSELYDEIHRHSNPTAALCLSGGGIRSATFSLGVVQGLAQVGLLDRFDYLSTVSGGGYLGGWLSAWIHHWGKARVLTALAQTNPEDPLRPEAEPIRNLRAYSNYLSPRLGLLSADVWTSIGTYLRNLILNLLILVPMLLAVLFVPRVCVELVRLAGGVAGNGQELNRWGWDCLALGYVLFVKAIHYAEGDLPSVKTKGQPESRYVLGHLAPFLGAAVLFSTGWAFLAPASRDKTWVVTVWSAVAGGGAFFLGRALRGQRPRLSAIVLGLAGGAAAAFLVVGGFPDPAQSVHDTKMYVALAAPYLLGVILLAGVLLVGWESFQDKGMKDEDREWWARSGAWVLISIVIWLFTAGVVLYAPALLIDAGGRVQAAIASAGGLSGVASALIGWSARTASGKDSSRSKLWPLAGHLASKLLAPLFAVALLSFLALGTSYAIGQWTLAVSECGPNFHDCVMEPASWARFWTFVAVALLLAGAGYGFGWRFSVNRFSMHGFYRNRLIRAYLGASRDRNVRSPHQFTGFDPKDNLKMQELRVEAPTQAQQSPLHLVNMTLNLASGKELAWQNRKGASFTASALHAGSSYLQDGYIDPANYTKDGLTLGTVMTISGAAVNPNQGFSSSPVLTFLMAIFDVRLGAWLPNPGPRGKKGWARNGPDSPLVLLEEALGMTDGDHAWVNLSDGGHFENLGLYEMVRRRCRYIVSVDASEDHTYNFESLSNALQKIRVDLGIHIEPLKPVRIWQKDTPGTSRYALYRIGYSDVDGAPQQDERLNGWLLYIKPGITGQEPRDILKYSNEHKDFPHETTVDQYFDESQFESYRELGRLSLQETYGAYAGPPDFSDFFNLVARP